MRTKQVDPYLFPARGRKRQSVIAGSNPKESLIPTFSPQGDGNSRSARSSICLGKVDPYLFPARGRKLLQDNQTLPKVENLLIPTFSPQGDGNSGQSNCSSHVLHVVDPYLFPARGRKRHHSREGLLEDSTLTVDPYLFPARGRKRVQVVR